MKNNQETLDQLISELREKEEKLQVFYNRLTKPGTPANHVDFLGIAVIKRSSVLIEGFITLLNANNYIAAAHLVRLHLDNYLRLYAIWMVEDALDFAKDILAGAQINQIKDRKGKE